MDIEREEGRKKNVQTWQGKTKRLAWTIKTILDGILCNVVIIGGNLTIVSALREHTQESYKIRTFKESHNKLEMYQRKANSSSSRVDVGSL